MLVISEISTDVGHVKGTEYVVEDTLSRPNVAEITGGNAQPLSPTALAEAQHVDSELHRLCLNDINITGLDKPLICNISAGSPRPFAPFSFRRQLYDFLDELSHTGIR